MELAVSLELTGRRQEAVDLCQDTIERFSLGRDPTPLLGFIVAQGLSNGEIAGKLFITSGTTKWHLNNIFSKLGVNSRTKAVSLAQQLNLL